MTSLLLTFVVMALIASCVLIGKYNKSDNLCLILLISLLAGMAGGAIVNKLNSKDGEKKNGLTQVQSSTQESPVNSIDLCAVLENTLDCMSNHTSNPVGQNTKILACDSKPFAPSKRIVEIRAQPFNLPLIRGVPVTPFDTS